MVCGQFAFHSTAEYQFYQPANNHLYTTVLIGCIIAHQGGDEMPGLDVFLFGKPRIERDGAPVTVTRRKALACSRTWP